MINQETIEQVKAKANIGEIIGGYIKLKKEGHDHTGLCPFHNEKTPSFKVSPARGIFKCFGCGKSGDVIAFVMEHENKSYPEAIAILAGKVGVALEEQPARKDFTKPVARLEKLGAKSLTWFEEKRKISNNTLLRFGITEAKEWMPQFDKEVGVICFNYFRDEVLVNIKFRGPEKSFKMAKDAELIFYNLDAVKAEKEVVIVEGEMDCLSCHEAGVYNSVSVPNGAGTGNQRLEYLDNCWAAFGDKERIILATDDDAPGRQLREQLSRRLGMERCFQVTYPSSCKDINEVLVKHGPEAVRKIIAAAAPWPVEGIVTMDEMYDDIKSFYEHGYPQGCKAKIPGLDDLVSYYPGQLTVVTGIPGSGKSEIVDYIAVNLTKHHGWVWGVCSFENPPAFHVTKLAEKITGRSFAFRKDLQQRITPAQCEEAIGLIDKYFHFMNISLVDITMDGLIKKAEEMVKRFGINGLIFDPWNCIEAKYEGESETKYVLTCLNKLIAFLEKYKVHGFLVAHPTKMNKNPSTRKYDVPTMYNISGSAHFFNRAHNGISVYRDFQTNIVDVHIQKVKWSWLGKLGFCSFEYNTMTRTYSPVGNSVLSAVPENTRIPYYENEENAF